MIGILVAVCLALAPPVAAAAAPDTVWLEELTWTEVRDSVRVGTTTVLVPTGGTEQNGPHLALGKHNAVMRWAAEQIARRLGRTLVAPVLAYVPEGAVAPPTGHMRFPGTLTLPDPQFRQVVEHAARSLRAGGFRDIVLLGDSGDNQPGLRAVAAALTREWAGTGVRVHFAGEYYRTGADPQGAFARWLREQGEAGDAGRHAGLADTSMLLAVDPRLVRTERLPEARAEGSGAAGDPSRASAAYGRRGLELRVEAAVAEIQRLIGAPAPMPARDRRGR